MLPGVEGQRAVVCRERAGGFWGFLVFVLTSRHVVFYLHFNKLTLKALWTCTYSQSMFILGKRKRFNW